jgi:hypothetical protein
MDLAHCVVDMYVLVDIHFDFCAPSYCSMARKFYETLLEVFKSLI